MRVCIEKATGKMIEMQSSATEGTLIQNAINAGFNAADVEEREVSQAEWQAILDAQPPPPQFPTTEERLAAVEAAILDIMEV